MRHGLQVLWDMPVSCTAASADAVRYCTTGSVVRADAGAALTSASGMRMQAGAGRQALVRGVYDGNRRQRARHPS